jgi:hypothetical protein
MVCVNIKLGLLLIFEQAYRTDPEKLKYFYTCNTYHKKGNPTFFNFKTNKPNKYLSLQERT